VTYSLYSAVSESQNQITVRTPCVRCNAHIFHSTLIGAGLWIDKHNSNIGLVFDGVMVRDKRTKRAVLRLIAGGTLAGMGGCLEVISNSEDESSNSVSPEPFTEELKSSAPVATLGGTERSDSFGRAVAATGDTVFVGDPQAAVDGVKKAGLVAVFEKSGSGWEQTARLTGRKHKNDRFGTHIAASGSTLLVGNEHNFSGMSPIPVSVFEQSNGDDWQLTTELADRVYVESMAVGGETAVLRTEDTDGLVDVFERESGVWRRGQSLSIDRRRRRTERQLSSD